MIINANDLMENPQKVGKNGTANGVGTGYGKRECYRIDAEGKKYGPYALTGLYRATRDYVLAKYGVTMQGLNQVGYNEPAALSGVPGAHGISGANVLTSLGDMLKAVEKYLNKTSSTNVEKFIEEVNNTQFVIYDETDIKTNSSTDIKSVSRDEIVEKMRNAKNQILVGPPGTGKTVEALKMAKRLSDSEDDNENSRIRFITFHQSYGYEEFVEGIRPVLTEHDNPLEDRAIRYEIKSGVFKQICKDAENDKEHNYVLVIDEINRGNISKIFGELITLIEESKRKGETHETKVILPYSGETFTVPANLYIIGTMNTADRSIAPIDTALRRRFTFIEMMPDAKKWKNGNWIDGIKFDKMLEKINERIEVLYDREHTIGHTYFYDMEEGNGMKKLKEIFKHKIIPLLQEYFFDDYEKIRLVLGDNNKSEKYQFVKEKTTADLFGKASYDLDIPEKRYAINENAFDEKESYIGIYDVVKKADNTDDESSQQDNA